MVLFLVISIVLTPAPANSNILEELEALGLKDVQTTTNDDGQIIVLRFRPSSGSDKAMSAISSLTKLIELDLSGSKVTDAGLAKLAGLTDLKKLGLPPAATDGGIAKLAPLTKLEELYIGESKITGTGLAKLTLPALVTLDASRSKFGDEGLAALSNSKNLQRLILRNTATTDKGLTNLSGLSKLTYLDLRSTAVSDTGLASLSGLQSLQHLDLSNSSEKITDAGLERLADLKEMRSLWLSRSAVSDKGFDSLKQIRALHELSLWKTQVTDKLFKKLQSLECFQNKRLKVFYIRAPGVTEKGLANFRKTLAKMHKSSFRLNP